MDINAALADLEAIVGPQRVLSSRAERAVYGYDASVFRGTELLAVVLPTTAEQISRLVVWCRERRRAVRGARHRHRHQRRRHPHPRRREVIELALMNQVLEVDLANRLAVVQPGVVNQDLKQRVHEHGYAYTYVPDPGSQVVSTIGRQRRHQRRRHALPEIRHHRQPHPRPGDGAAGRRHRDGGRQRRRTSRAPISPGLLVGSEGHPRASSPRSSCACCKCPEARSPPTWRCSRERGRCGQHGSPASSAPGLLPGRHGTVGQVDHAGRWTRPCTSVSRHRPAPPLIIELDGFSEDMGRATPTGVAEICKTHDVISFETRGGASRRASGCGCAAARLSAPWRGSTRTSTSSTTAACPRSTQLPEALRRVTAIAER